jgi:Mitochondrial carrier protein
VLKTLAQTNKDKSSGLMALVNKMYADQGVAGFYRGVEVNIVRACILNATKMGVYDASKGVVTDYTGWDRKDLRTSFSAAFVAGFFMTCTGTTCVAGDVVSSLLCFFRVCLLFFVLMCSACAEENEICFGFVIHSNISPFIRRIPRKNFPQNEHTHETTLPLKKLKSPPPTTFAPD